MRSATLMIAAAVTAALVAACGLASPADSPVDSPAASQTRTASSSLSPGSEFPSAAAVSCSNDAPAPTIDGKKLDLTGVWAWGKRGTFYLREAGTCLYLLGQSTKDAEGPPGKGFTTVFIGGISSDGHIVGIWSDVPYGQISGGGTVEWQIDLAGSEPALHKLRSTGGWDAIDLTRTSP